MGLFFSSDRFTRPGPGVRPDAPRKKGVARLAEIMGRDMWNFFRAGFLAFLGCLPFIIGMFFAVETHALLFMLLAGIIGGLIAGPELSAMADTVLRSLRDEPGYWWETYRRVWKRNARESLVPGMLTGLVREVIFKGVHFEMHVDVEGYEWLIHSTQASQPGELIGMNIGPDEIHIMKRSEV